MEVLLIIYLIGFGGLAVAGFYVTVVGQIAGERKGVEVGKLCLGWAAYWPIAGLYLGSRVISAILEEDEEDG